jgi:2-dehydro-3-deoxyphosphogluconate aldolase / (4S)-4-hydroxy-2-oxoglutarate aldolase
VNKAEARSLVVSTGIVPVIRASSPQKALMAVDALRASGIAIAEITLTVPGAEKVIESLRKRFDGDLLVGAGSVLDVEGAKRCLDAGAQFIVSPGFDAATVEFVAANQVLMMAGALTPTEVIRAWKTGADLVKVFPCNAVGGPSYIKALKGPLPQVPMVPTGGVNLKTAADFIKAGSEALGVGGELVQASALDNGTPALITDLGRQFLEIVQSARNAKSTVSAV